MHPTVKSIIFNHIITNDMLADLLLEYLSPYMSHHDPEDYPANFTGTVEGSLLFDGQDTIRPIRQLITVKISKKWLTLLSGKL